MKLIKSKKKKKKLTISYKIKVKHFHFEDFLRLCSYDRADVDGFINLLSRCTEVDKEIFYNLRFADLIRFVDELVDSVDKEMYKAPKKAIKINDRYYKLIDLLNFSVVIPTQWNLKNISNFEHFLNILEKSKYVCEIIVIDNDNKNIKLDLSKYKKVKHIVNSENIYVNPSWNLGYSICNKNNKLIFANDDLKIYDDNIDIIFELL
ncbi:MAG TPA: hypothetical protein PLV79_07825, partial [Bacteroidales bacterium]|nr:hypothetical protein [Bacteroidales bacterium]